MNKKEAIESIKNATKAISLLFSVHKDELSFEAVKVKDGDMMVDVQGEFAVGAKVMTSSSQGAVAAADGQYDLSNGQSFTVKDGKIDKIISDGKNAESEDKTAPAEEAALADAPAEGSPEEEAGESPADEAAEDEDADAANTAAIEALTEKISEIYQLISAIKDAMAGKASKEDIAAMGEQFTAIQSAFEVLAETPSEFSKVDKSVEAKEDKFKKLDALAALVKKN